MPALTTREEARARLFEICRSAIERLVPRDAEVPLKGATFADFENQTYEAGNEILAAMMEERAKLDSNAVAKEAGRCPHGGSPRTYLKKKVTKAEVRSPSGPLLIEKQHARCRACGGSFFPSAPGLGAAY